MDDYLVCIKKAYYGTASAKLLRALLFAIWIGLDIMMAGWVGFEAFTAFTGWSIGTFVPVLCSKHARSCNIA